MATTSDHRDLLGWSLALPEVEPGVDLARDIAWTVGPNGRDLAIVAGPENLEQSLAVTLTTPLGDDVFNTAFGFAGLQALVDETNPVLTRERMRVAVVQTVRADPRVRRIVDVRLDDAGGVVASGDALEQMRRSRELSVTVVFETVTYQQSTLTVGTVGNG